MKANESVKNFAPVLRQYANYTTRGIKKVCTEIGARPAGSEQERTAQEQLAKDMESCCDSVETQEFKLSPHAFMSWIPICVGLMTAAAVVFQFGWVIISMLLTILSFFCVITEFLLYKQTLDVILPQKTSRNVVGIRKASGAVKRRIVFSGHVDSAMEWRFIYYGGPKVFAAVVVTSFLGFFFNLAICLVALSSGYVMQTVHGTAFAIPGYVLLAFIPVYLVAVFFNNWKSYVHGANDNLSGSFASVAVLKFMQDNGIRFENTEVWAVTTGAEEAGLRGAKAFCKQYATQMDAVETVFIGLETLRDDAHTAIYKRDMTNTVKNSVKACRLVQEAARNAGYELPQCNVFFGASDAAAVSQAGYHATTLASMDPTPARYYHTRLDTHDNLDAKVIEKGINIALETAFLFDEKGLG